MPTSACRSFTDNVEREKQVDFVNYYSAGIQWAAAAGKTVDPDERLRPEGRRAGHDLRGHRRTAREGQACVDAGKPAIQITAVRHAGCRDERRGARPGRRHERRLARHRCYAISQTDGKLRRPASRSTSRRTASPSTKGSGARRGGPGGHAVARRRRHLRRHPRRVGRRDGGDRHRSRSTRRRTADARRPPPGRATRQSAPAGGPGAAPVPIKAVRLRHPWRIVFAVVLARHRRALRHRRRAAPGLRLADRRQVPLRPAHLAGGARTPCCSPCSRWSSRIILGIILAVMRLSPNPVVKCVAWVYLWIFRGTPVYVQLVFWGLIATIYHTIDIGIPFTEPWVSFRRPTALINAVLARRHRPGAQRGGVHGRDRARRPPLGRPGPGRGGDGARHELVADDAPRRPAAGDARHHPADRQRGHLDAEDHLARHGGAVHASSCTAAPATSRPRSSTRSRCSSSRRSGTCSFTSVLMVGQYFLEKRFARGVGDRPDTGPGRRSRSADRRRAPPWSTIRRSAPSTEATLDDRRERAAAPAASAPTCPWCSPRPSRRASAPTRC